MSLWAPLAALGASGCAATASALQHRTAVAVRAAEGTNSATEPTTMTSARATVTHPMWLLAVGLQGCGFLLHAAALAIGQLIVVQPLLVCVVLVALPLNHALGREPITRRELGWAALLVAALAGFLVTASTSIGIGPETADAGPAVVAAVAGALAVAGCLLIAWRQRSRRGLVAGVLGAGAGILFAGQAALLKSSVGLLSGGVLALLGNWQPYLLIVVGLCGILCCQLAFRAGPLSASLPLVNTVNPLLGVVIGVLVYDEQLRHSAPALAAELLCLAALTLATVMLTRLEHAPPGGVAAGPATRRCRTGG
ncbi:MAG TPA: DMT family transporter [Pseudonocardiaceae bacterium]|nr:DMT family transporter [Pseudonocardiaceae bacterium]